MDQTDATVRPDTLQAMERVQHAPQTSEQGKRQWRYALSVEDQWVVAVGKYAAVYLTSEREDAGTWASHDEAVEAAKIVTSRLSKRAWVEVLVEPAYPRTWRLQ